MSWDGAGLRRWAAQAPERERRALDRIGALGQAIARARARVRTGRMRSRIEWKGRVDEIEAGAPYTPYMEFGTRYVRAQPMLGPAAEAMGDAVPVEFDREFD